MQSTLRTIRIVAVVAVLLAVTAPVAHAVTKNQAYKIARNCLLKEAHASFVGRRGDGGGFATWNTNAAHGSTFWTYKTVLGQVASVTYYFAGRPGLPQRTKRIVKRCLQRGI
jgi:hypothetical protein